MVRHREKSCVLRHLKCRLMNVPSSSYIWLYNYIIEMEFELLLPLDDYAQSYVRPEVGVKCAKGSNFVKYRNEVMRRCVVKYGAPIDDSPENFVFHIPAIRDEVSSAMLALKAKRKDNQRCVWLRKKLKCPECGKKIHFARDLEAHLRSHTTDRTCKICKIAFTTKSSHVDHIISVHRYKKEKCLLQVPNSLFSG